MGRNKVLVEDACTFSIVITKTMRTQLRAVSLLTGRSGALSSMIREILAQYIETYSENNKEFDLMVSNLMDQDPDQEPVAEPDTVSPEPA